MDSKDTAVAILESIFNERKAPAFSGKQEGPRRPKRSEKSGYKGHGYSGPGGAMKGRDTDEPEDKKKKVITEFEDMDDWVLSMILVSIMHANPDMTPNEAIALGKKWVKKLHMPRHEHIWQKQTSRIRRFGIRAEASKIRREMFKLI